MPENKKRYGMVIDLRKCVGCHACTVACKMENDLPQNCFNTWVEDWDYGSYPDVSKIKLPKMCNHCVDAPCIEVCPVEATFALENGSIVVNEDKCIGCGACIVACPYEARYMKPDKKAGKCTFCVGRAESGLMPSCVSTCVSHARYFGDLNDPESDVAKLIKENKVQGLKEELGLDLSVVYIGLNKLGPEPLNKFRGGKE